MRDLADFNHDAERESFTVRLKAFMIDLAAATAIVLATAGGMIALTVFTL